MKAKKLSALMLVLKVAFILCSCQKEEKIVAYINYAEELEESRPDVYSIAAADKYLAEQGYPRCRRGVRGAVGALSGGRGRFGAAYGERRAHGRRKYLRQNIYAELVLERRADGGGVRFLRMG